MTQREGPPSSSGVFAALMEIGRRMREGMERGIWSLTLEQREIRQELLETSDPRLGPLLGEDMAKTLKGEEETTGLNSGPGDLT